MKKMVQTEKKEIEQTESLPQRKVKLTHKFVTALSIVSILGFLGIVSESLFELDLSGYVEAGLMLVIGIGMMLEANLEKIKTIKEGLNSSNFTHLTTIVIGAIAILAGIFSLPPIRVETAGFLAIKGIMSIIAIIVIAIQTWVMD
jgi:hypothetical protein